MRRLVSVFVAVVLASNAWAGVSTSVYRADEKTALPLADPNVPNVYRDIMVGTRLTVFVSSDTDGYWFGSLLIPWPFQGNGLLSGRGYDEDGAWENFWGSCLEAAGDLPRVIHSSVPSGLGFELLPDLNAIAGDWFVLDYRAEEVGTCCVALYGDESVYSPIQLLSFAHVPSRDFDKDTVVNFTDFALLASQWRQVVVADPNMNGSPDLNADGSVDTFDMALFSTYWLERTDVNEPDAEPGAPAAGT